METLRHLVFATDAWVSRAILGQPSPWDPEEWEHRLYAERDLDLLTSRSPR